MNTSILSRINLTVFNSFITEVNTVTIIWKPVDGFAEEFNELVPMG